MTARKIFIRGLKWFLITLAEVIAFVALKSLSALTGVTRLALETTTDGKVKVNGFKTTRIA